MKTLKKKPFQYNYDCVICMDLCKKPISCIRCHKLICHHHLKLLNDKCPHCRLEPLQYQQQPMIQSYIQIQINKKKEELKKSSIFKCLVERCNFQGNFSAMVFHKKSRHPYQKIDEILFPEDRKRKMMREVLKKIFLQKYVDEAKKYHEEALKVYIKNRGLVGMKQLTLMIAHIDNCSHQECKSIIFTQQYGAIGISDEVSSRQSGCPKAKQLKAKI